MRFTSYTLLSLILLVCLGACGKRDGGDQLSSADVALSPTARLGKQLFFDPRLSASGKLSCASCHDPAHAYGPPDGAAARIGGAHMDRTGTRAVPSLRYKNFTPMFSIHYYIGRGEDMEDEGPTGGFTADGRVNSLADQAAIPLLDANEMANANKAEVVAHIIAAGYADKIKALFGDKVIGDESLVFNSATQALQAFQDEDESFHPYSSKYDKYLRHEAKLTPSEEHGLLMFNRRDKGNCAQCHMSWPGPNGRPPLFTDFGFSAVGVPRNEELPVNADTHYYDMGVCGPGRHDMAKHQELCGMFKTPTLRNVASRHVFFHNGRFHTLEDMMHFYVERDTDPGHWYPSKAGKVDKFNDLPPKLRQNVDTRTAPFNRKLGDKPALTADEISDVIAFLKTLDDADVKP